jgi:hypothetical protein
VCCLPDWTLSQNAVRGTDKSAMGSRVKINPRVRSFVAGVVLFSFAEEQAGGQEAAGEKGGQGALD